MFISTVAETPSKIHKLTLWFAPIAHKLESLCYRGRQVDLRRKNLLLNAHHLLSNWRYMKRFSTQGPVNPEQHYVVPRTEELTEFIKRVKEGRYIVIFAPRQTGKTTFFYAAMDILAAEAPTYLPIHLDFEAYKTSHPPIFTVISLKTSVRKLRTFTTNAEKCLPRR